MSMVVVRSQVIDSMVNVYAEQIPFEKLHLHFDKDVYRAGETIWFKAYLFAGFSPSLVGKNLYAELVSSSGNVVQRKVYPIIESASAGSFDVPDSLSSGNYLIRSYTAWMLNFDTAFLFQKNIQLLDKNGLFPNKKIAESDNQYSMQFLPEGGNLVNTLTSVVAFIATDKSGLPIKVKGQIVNGKGESVSEFSSLHDGMGSFELTPNINETYLAKWTTEDGKQQTTPLPVAKEQGCVLKLTGVGGRKLFQITRTKDVPADWRKVNIIALLDQVRIYKAKANLEDLTITTGAIPTADLPSGILQVTIFSDTWEPIAERIMMVDNNNYSFDVNVNTPELNTNFRAKNTLEITVEDTLLTNMSLAITDAAVGRLSSADNIISRLLLTGDIKGYVHNPSYYFSNPSDSYAQHLDLVMLTHGWRKYNWGSMSRGKKPALKYPYENYLAIEAKAYGVTNVTPIRPDEQIFVIVQTKDLGRKFFEMTKSGPDKFYSPGVFIFDTATLYYQFMKDKKSAKDLSLGFTNNFFKGVKNMEVVKANPLIIADTAMLSRAKFFAEKNNQFNYGNVLEAVTVKSKTRIKSRSEELDEKYASGMFRSSDAYTFDFTTDGSAAFINIFSYLQGRVAGLQISGIGSNVNLSWRGSSPMLYLNEMPSDVEGLSTVSAADIAYVKVLRPPFMGGIGGGAGGAIAVYTRRGSERQPEPGSLGLNKTIIVGYNSVKQFYSPDYQDLTVSANTPSDFRSTLYWNPFVLTDGNRQKLKFTFYNNDITKAFRIVLEGVNEIGKLVRIEKVFQQTK